MAENRSGALKLSAVFLVICLALSPTYLNSLVFRSWVAPAEGDLSVSEGSFASHNLVDCNSRYCSNGPYTFRTQAGDTLELNCEPGPAINQCLDSDGFGRRTRGLDGKSASVQYYNDNEGRDIAPYYVMLDVEASDGKLISYGESVSSIKNSVISIDEYGSHRNRSNNGQAGVHTVYMMYGYILCTTLSLIFFLFSFFRFIFVKSRISKNI
ncbi:hypothetical protein [Asticcacaulis benevestitus]|uniref:hypothetical protein n=1 Tax=Asticcacaulis benevestitus TaxID=347481 RepID=UPI000ACFBC7A|nr:hypothetical protein [Asticcacaulis benevestitus]